MNGFGRGLAGNPTAFADGLDDRREKEGIGVSPLGGGVQNARAVPFSEIQMNGGEVGLKNEPRGGARVAQ